MEQLTIRATTAALPDLDGASLQDVDTLVTRIGVLEAFRLSGAGLRSLEISGQRLTSGQVSGLHAGRARLEGLRMHCVDFTGCDLSQAACTGGRWSRVRFTDCKILAGQFRDVAFENVIFDRCKLDLAAFQAMTAKGPVIFRDCSLEDALFSGCDLSRAAFDGCRMTATTFERALGKGTDLRGNDLSAIRGIASLRQAVIEPAQAIQLGHALIADLDLRLPDD
jgi:uncharacterized protein YjbI with pentapeptide repeats